MDWQKVMENQSFDGNLTHYRLEEFGFGWTLGVCLMSVLMLQVVFFLLGTLLKVEVVKDVAGGVCFIVVALGSFLWNYRPGQLKLEPQKDVIATVLVSIWAFRLATYLLVRHIRMGQPILPYLGLTSYLQQTVFWLFQIVWVFVVSLPVVSINSSSGHVIHSAGCKTWSNKEIAGVALFAIGGALEFIADQQKYNWKRNPQHQGSWCYFGMWKWSRHPNYFFDVIAWWGMFILSLQSNWTVQWVCLASPVMQTSVILFVSGLPVIEAASEQKYGRVVSYGVYRTCTSIFFPIPPVVYKHIPEVVKHTILLDFPMYRTKAKAYLVVKASDIQPVISNNV